MTFSKYPTSIARTTIVVRACLAGMLVSASAGCSLSNLVGESEVPAGTSDPALIATEAGAKGLYHGTVQTFATAIGEYVVPSGLISDELRPSTLGSAIGASTIESVTDARFLPGLGNSSSDQFQEEIVNRPFALLQKVRGAASQARGALRTYAPLAPQALLGHLYALEGYADLLLADMFCSGIPLTEVRFNGDYVLKPGSSTAQVYEKALALFDSALVLSADSASILDFAKIGKARALIGLRRYAEVSDVVADVPVSYQYAATFSAASDALRNKFWRNPLVGRGRITVSDGEGVDSRVGIRYDSLKDPRVRLVYRGGPDASAPYRLYLPQNYDSTGTRPIIVASGIEAQLLRAEAELNTGGAWLATLNALRAGCVTPVPCATPISPLIDPGNSPDRIALLFQERALWLFLTGHRHGDMRRMVRDYEVPSSQVFVTGRYYQSNVNGSYEMYLNFPVPRSEQESNAAYGGCDNRDS